MALAMTPNRSTKNASNDMRPLFGKNYTSAAPACLFGLF